jgi:hypothetical protein
VPANPAHGTRQAGGETPKQMEQTPEWDASSEVEEQELEVGAASASIASFTSHLIQPAAERSLDRLSDAACPLSKAFLACVMPLCSGGF